MAPLSLTSSDLEMSIQVRHISEGHNFVTLADTANFILLVVLVQISIVKMVMPS